MYHIIHLRNRVYTCQCIYINRTVTVPGTVEPCIHVCMYVYTHVHVHVHECIIVCITDVPGK